MNLMDIVKFIEELIRSDARAIAFFVVGVGVAIFLGYTFRKWVFPPHEKDKLTADVEAPSRGREQRD